MMIAAILVAMAVGISTTTPRTTAESGSTESGRDNNLEYRARARGYDGALNNNKNNNTAADNNNVWTLPVKRGRRLRRPAKELLQASGGTKGSSCGEAKAPQREGSHPPLEGLRDDS